MKTAFKLLQACYSEITTSLNQKFSYGQEQQSSQDASLMTLKSNNKLPKLTITNKQQANKQMLTSREDQSFKNYQCT